MPDHLPPLISPSSLESYVERLEALKRHAGTEGLGMLAYEIDNEMLQAEDVVRPGRSEAKMRVIKPEDL